MNTRLLVSIITASLVAAQSQIDAASFGGRHSLELGNLPGWNRGGSQQPQVLTDKVIFTPPYPGDVSSSAWTSQRIHDPSFTIETKFLVNGPDHAGGNLQIWYAQEGESVIGSQTLYTVDKFTGLVISIDQHGGPGGGIRGFLNDGSMSFKHHPHLDTAAFGHCGYPYRNRGLPSKLKIKHDTTGLEVSIDDRPCFKTDKIALPPDYFLGITASSSATPDSIEISKFITTTNPPSSSSDHQHQQHPQHQILANEAGGSQRIVRARDRPPQVRSPPASPAAAQNNPQIEHITDMLASTLSTSSSQFEDLHNRLQSLGHNTERLFTEYLSTSTSLSGRIEELHSQLARYDQVRELESQIRTLQQEIHDLRMVVEGGRGETHGLLLGVAQSVNDRHDRLESGLHERIVDGVAKRGPKVGVWFVALVAVQVFAVAAFLAWRRRERERKAGKYL